MVLAAVSFYTDDSNSRKKKTRIFHRADVDSFTLLVPYSLSSLQPGRQSHRVAKRRRSITHAEPHVAHARRPEFTDADVPLVALGFPLLLHRAHRLIIARKRSGIPHGPRLLKRAPKRHTASPMYCRAALRSTKSSSCPTGTPVRKRRDPVAPFVLFMFVFYCSIVIREIVVNPNVADTSR